MQARARRHRAVPRPIDPIKRHARLAPSVMPSVSRSRLTVEELRRYGGFTRRAVHYMPLLDNLLIRDHPLNNRLF